MESVVYVMDYLTHAVPWWIIIVSGLALLYAWAVYVERNRRDDDN